MARLTECAIRAWRLSEPAAVPFDLDDMRVMQDATERADCEHAMLCMNKFRYFTDSLHRTVERTERCKVFLGDLS